MRSKSDSTPRTMISVSACLATGTAMLIRLCIHKKLRGIAEAKALRNWLIARRDRFNVDYGSAVRELSPRLLRDGRTVFYDVVQCLIIGT